MLKGGETVGLTQSNFYFLYVLSIFTRKFFDLDSKKLFISDEKFENMNYKSNNI